MMNKKIKHKPKLIDNYTQSLMDEETAALAKQLNEEMGIKRVIRNKRGKIIGAQG